MSVECLYSDVLGGISSSSYLPQLLELITNTCETSDNIIYIYHVSCFSFIKYNMSIFSMMFYFHYTIIYIVFNLEHMFVLSITTVYIYIRSYLH